MAVKEQRDAVARRIRACLQEESYTLPSVAARESHFFFEGYSKYCLQPWDVKDKYAAGKAADLM